MGRPKGSLQKNRDEKKYWLPEGVVLLPDNPLIYNKITLLKFMDARFGEFVSSFVALQGANASTHPKAIAERREKTNLQRYGTTNPGANKEVADKRRATTKARFGYEHALQNPDLFNKQKQTLKERYGMNHLMDSPNSYEKIKKTNLERYGVIHPSCLPEYQEKAKQTCLDRYGVDNASKSNVVKEKILEKCRGSSKGEREVLAYVQELGFPNAHQGYFGGADPLQADIKISEIKYAIEFHGVYWHSQEISKKASNFHQRKYIAAKNNGYKLLQVFDMEWKYRNFQVKSFIRSALGKNERVVYGRQTVVEKIPAKVAEQFLEDNHILGAPISCKDAYGLVCDNELLCVVTMGKHHRTGKEMVLTRYCGKFNVTVAGGLSKLCKAIAKDFPEFTTFIDLRMSNGENWLNNGWELVSENPPDYFYYDKANEKVVKKQAMSRRNKKYPPDVTESQYAKSQGLLTIYDAGKLKLKWTGK